MRRREKEMAKDFLAVLAKAHYEIKKAVGRENKEQACPLLAQCQQGAMELGDLIASTEGEDCPIIGLLEDYCELVYQIYDALERERPKSPEGIYQRLKKKLTKLERCLEEEVPLHREAVFFPYKVSMWDSLESVFHAAMEDPLWDVYVCPIPYYEMNPDGTFGQMHDESVLYDKSLPLVDWRSYDPARRRPDAIFIHNPYDGDNFITSVHPDFYAARLYTCTDCLAYVPYFLLPGKFEKDFVPLPGVTLAHRVFVQNERIRQGYLKTLRSLGGEAEHVDWDSRIVAAGSPKTDAIIRCQETGVPIPPEWKKIIQGKKVLFFNTNVSMILKNTDHFLEHLQQIFEVIRSHKEFAVIWREHPLTTETLRSMRPQLAEDYLAERNRFVSERWGILDTSPSPYPAMTVSDCYFGAGGSLLVIYPMTGKPVMIADYLYPARISPEPITLREMLASASKRLLYLERNINSLDLFLSQISVFEAQREQRIERQSDLADYLDGTVGRRIFDHVKTYLDEIQNGGGGR